MNPLALSLFLSLVALPFEVSSALRLGITGKRVPRPHTHHRRASIFGTTTLADSYDVSYSTNITLNGAPFSVQIDTGSSDLYVIGNVPRSQNTGKTAEVTYAVGGVQGPIMTADLDFAGYNISKQAYIQVTADKDHSVGTGLIGLGPSYGSQVRQALNDSSGDPVLDRVFTQNTSTPNYITILLGRAEDPLDDFPGDLTVGEVLPGYENITSQPKLDVSLVSLSSAFNQQNQHWQALLDVHGVIGPDGKAVDVETSVQSTSNKKQLTVVFDTGYSLPQVPSNVAEAFYGNVPGAKLMNYEQLDGPIWQLPCAIEVNVTFQFGGVSYPINPLDTTIDLNATDSDGNHVCFGAFQPQDAALSPNYDIIFGMAFLRNVYLYINFGDFVDGSPSSRAAPYIQLLSTSANASRLHSDFVAIRGSQTWDPTSSSLGRWVRSHLALVIGLSVSAGLILIGAVLLCVVQLRKRRMAPTPAGFMSFSTSYKRLNDPAPSEAYDLHMAGRPGAPLPVGQEYANPWDPRF
ncbi:acid protease [Obba rivulosa]|uniref:Acid protease n=1 Tax=Obba rivulosa TaxID=1052685 RepID=A0A8E2APR4_9APHY|nr:acid protease [Obba rivulosa]